MLSFGVDCLEDNADLLTGRVALITTSTGRNSRGQSTIDVLRQLCNLQLLLAPEHGIRGDRAAGEVFESETDSVTGLEILSMYSGTSKRLPREAFKRIDTIVYDIQDVGCRYYTYLSTLKLLIEDCARYGKRLVVLDRPNPLGDRVEGIQMQRELVTFVGCHPMPVCYGLTCGEFARMVQSEEHWDCDLHVVLCVGLLRKDSFPDWGKGWLPPSPNIPNYETALLYPGVCLIEGTNLSEGRGTSAPFATIGAPFVNGQVLCAAFEELKLPGIWSEPIRFTPSASKYKGELCSGIRLHVEDAATLRPTNVGIYLLDVLHNLYPAQVEWLPGEAGIPFVSQLAGHREFEKWNWNSESLIARAEQDRIIFQKRKKQFEIYRN